MTTRKATKKQQGYQSIGSFHNDNLVELLTQDDATYQPPPLPFPIHDEEDEDDTKDEEALFFIDRKAWTFLNHGAFGGALRRGWERAEAWRRYAETQPLRFHDRILLPHLAHSGRVLSRFLVSPSSTTSSNHNIMTEDADYALLPNVTSGMNAVLANYCHQQQRHAGAPHIILWDVTYGSVKSMARHYVQQHHQSRGSVTEIPLVRDYLSSSSSIDATTQCSSSGEILTRALLEHTTSSSSSSLFPMDKDGPPPLLLLDHTTSNTALTFDVKALAQAARQHIHPETWVVVDGAHGLWAHTDIGSLLASTTNNNSNHNDNPENDSAAIDVYLTNGHKWLAAPRGVALAWARRRPNDNDKNNHNPQSLLTWPAVLSHGMHAPDVFSRFVWDGCRDYSAALAVPAVLDYWNTPLTSTTESENGTTTTRWQQGRNDVQELLWQGLAYLAQEWHGMRNSSSVSLLQQEGFDRGILLAPYEQGWLHQAPMVLMRLPRHWETKDVSTSDDAKRIQDYLYDNYVEVPIKCVEGKLYVRVSCHVYNRMEDFARLAHVLKQ